MFRMPQGANTDTQTSNGTQPNQNLKKKFTKIGTPTQFFESPKILKP